MKLLYSFLFLTVAAPSAFSQPGIIWSTEVPGAIGTLRPPRMGIDSNGNILVLNLKRTSSGSDIWLVKLSPSGELLWEVSFDGDAHLTDYGNHITIDAEGSIFVFGITFVYESYDGGSIFAEISPVALKYSADGQLLWHHVIPVPQWSTGAEANALAADNAGNCYVAAGVEDATNFLPTNHLIKYDTLGNIVWDISDPNDSIRVTATALNFLGDSIRLRSKKRNIFTEERTVCTQVYDLNGNLLSENTKEAEHWYVNVLGETKTGNLYYLDDRFIFNYDVFNNRIWEYQYDASMDNINSILFDFEVDAGNNVFLTGAEDRMFTLKLDGEGNLLWKTANSRSSAGRHMDVDVYGNTLVGCYFYENQVFSINVVKYDTVGNEIGSFIRPDANIDDLLVYDDASFIILIRDFSSTTPSFTVQKIGLDISTGARHVPVKPLRFFPNPTQQQINMEWDSATGQEGELTILDVNGRVLEEAAIVLHAGAGFDVSSLPNGLYLVRITAGKEVCAGRFVVAR
ncbi:MAG: T9SS type A sorting domain-containing protein [Phaeodactylibacter sp.]|nr:T9SS type A sorting domain-containing protein [Phaeodactylibacter sp.]MCB9295094.1 T9SS type A sorting domain-containing protein [Lewinellaceae bacterium]